MSVPTSRILCRTDRSLLGFVCIRNRCDSYSGMRPLTAIRFRHGSSVNPFPAELTGSGKIFFLFRSSFADEAKRHQMGYYYPPW